MHCPDKKLVKIRLLYIKIEKERREKCEFDQ